ncbi:hypothetical protein DRQ15_08300 [candidate division KSB1 bacterium]|nr:MAG: hypothetical protein B5M50_03985 [candidate division KSB1 bacterium 4484_219]RKY90062.1 MAG: hypothetical protein DRQ15_08300 [candidate division KSB1 bacterium]
MRNRVEYVSLKFLNWVVHLLPYPLALQCSKVLGFLLFSVARVRRRVVLSNLRRAFPEKSFKEIKRIAWQNYVHFSRVAIEYLNFPRFYQHELSDFVDFNDKEILDEVRKTGKGAILVGGHLGNWEILGAAISRQGYPLTAIVADQRNTLIDHWMNEYRSASGMKIFRRKEAAKAILQALKKGEFVILLSDQDAGKDGVFVNYFGTLVSAPAGAAVFALRTNAKLIYVSCVFNGNKYRTSFRPIDVEQYRKLDYFEALRQITQAFTNLLEAEVRTYPHQWFWMHRRWKSSPKTE